MRVRILNLEQSSDWQRILSRLPQHDAYFLPGYHRAYEENGDGTALAFVAEAAEGTLFYPFLLRPIEQVGDCRIAESWYDIETVYGYSGPLATSADPDFLHRAWDAFLAWCVERRIVAEFVRFHPVVDTTRYFDSRARVARQRETVVLDIAATEEALWASYPSRQRNMVRKARNRGLVGRQADLASELEVFKDFYGRTVARLGVDRYYAFSDAYFSTLIGGLGDHIRLFEVRDGDRVAAAALFLVRGDQMSYHLAGSDACYRRDAPNNLLLHTAALWGLRHGCRWLHLGGGVSTASDDPLLRFKTSISRRRVPFYIGTRIHRPEAYEALCAQWLAQHHLTEKPSYFLLYRLEGAP